MRGPSFSSFAVLRQSLANRGPTPYPTDVDVLVRPDGLEAFKQVYLGRGYVEKFRGSKGLRDATVNVKIDVLLTGEYPGDGKEKPVAFPDPATAATSGFSLKIEYRQLWQESSEPPYLHIP